MKMKCRQKPIEVEAVKWTGNNKEEVEEFLDGFGFVKGNYVDISTPDGLAAVHLNDYITKDAYGDYRCVNRRLFRVLYEIITERQ